MGTRVYRKKGDYSCKKNLQWERGSIEKWGTTRVQNLEMGTRVYREKGDYSCKNLEMGRV